MIVVRQHKVYDSINFELHEKLYSNFCYIAFLWQTGRFQEIFILFRVLV
jgi:hypothetical protein